MLIQETHKDVPTQADGKKGSMSMQIIIYQCTLYKADNSRDFPFPSSSPELSQCAGCPIQILDMSIAEAFPDAFPVLFSSARSIKVRVWFALVKRRIEGVPLCAGAECIIVEMHHPHPFNNFWDRRSIDREGSLVACRNVFATCLLY